MNNNLGRNNVPWKPELWSRIDQAVHAEAKRTRVARKFLEVVPLSDAQPLPANIITDPLASLLTIDEGAVAPLVEIWVEFALTHQQVENEERWATAVTLATRATNLLAQGEDLLIFQGQGVIRTDPRFTNNRIRSRGGPTGVGLLDFPQGSVRKLEVKFADPQTKKYGEKTFEKVAEGYSDLQNSGHYGPYALVLHTNPFADAHAPLEKTLIMPADRIKPLVTEPLMMSTDRNGPVAAERFFGTGTVPPKRGVLLSLGGSVRDLVVDMDPATATDTFTAFLQQDSEGRYRFRVFERFALRDKDPSGRIRLEFE